ncbi:MAG: hypothetical protein Kapaf2KO_11710 [Candidatus Kapaibacteriales bacterium]
MTAEIRVENIKCGGCINSIKTALLRNESIQDVSVDKETETIRISSNSSLFDREQIVQRLAKMGYPEIGNNNLLRKAKSFVSCAIGNISEKA